MFELHYLHKGSPGEPFVCPFDTLDELRDYIIEIYDQGEGKKVYLICGVSNRLNESLEDSEITVTETEEGLIHSLFTIDDFGAFPKRDKVPDITFFLQEYDTYEEAYIVALMMREGNPLSGNFLRFITG